MLRFSIILLLVAVLLAFLAMREWQAHAEAATPPQEMTLMELLVRGVGQNPKVSLYAFEFDARFAFVEGRFDGPWRAVWIPIHPPPPPASEPAESSLALGTQRADGEELIGGIYLGDREGRLPGQQRDLKAIRTLVVSRRLHSGADVQEFASRKQLQGRVLPDVTVLEQHDQDLLRTKFPGLDLGKCLLIETDEAPRGMWLLLTYALGAVASIGLSGWLFRSWRGQPPKPSTTPSRRTSVEVDEELENWQQALNRRRPKAGYERGED
jgi:hypothetical protein